MTDDKPQSHKPAKKDLLDELQSIKGLLDDTTPKANTPKPELPQDLDIPTLDDVVEGLPLNSTEDSDPEEPIPSHATTSEKAESSPPELLDLASIFEDTDSEPEEAPTTDGFLDSSFNFDFEDLEFDELTMAEERHTADERKIAQPEDTLQETSDKHEKPAEDTEDFLLSDDLLYNEAEPELSSSFNLDDLDTNVDIPNFKLSTEPLIETSAEEKNNEARIDDSLLMDDEINSALNDSIDHRFHTDYEEEQNELFPGSVEESPSESVFSSFATPAEADEEVDINLLIQEIVDEFIPVLEDELRQKLSRQAPAVIHQLARKYLDK